jgi:hypothetical protein
MLREKMMCMKVDDRVRHGAKMLDQLMPDRELSAPSAASDSDTNEIRKVPWPEWWALWQTTFRLREVSVTTKDVRVVWFWSGWVSGCLTHNFSPAAPHLRMGGRAKNY